MQSYDKQAYDTLGDKLQRVDWGRQELKPFKKDFYSVSINQFRYCNLLLWLNLSSYP